MAPKKRRLNSAPSTAQGEAASSSPPGTAVTSETKRPQPPDAEPTTSSQPPEEPGDKINICSNAMYSHVSLAICKKIWDGEFVDFKMLYL